MNAFFVRVLTLFLGVLRNPISPFPDQLVPEKVFQKAQTPVIWQRMAPLLGVYPHRAKAILILKGFMDDFVVPPFEGEGCTWVANLSSVSAHPDVVHIKIAKEVAEGRVAGPFPAPPFANFRISPLGIVPKKEPNEFRLIHHLSFPKDYSLNDQVDGSSASVGFSSFDDAVVLLRRFGSHCLMGKADIKAAFRLLSVHPDGFNSLGFQFDGLFYFDRCLPMGFSLSCFYFESFSSFLHWAVLLGQTEAGLVHYLDDFLFVGAASSNACLNVMQQFFDMCSYFNFPLAHEKTVWPCTKLEFLGISIDSVRMEFSLPENKLVRMLDLLQKMSIAKKTTLRELQTLLGLLNFACRVIPMGRVFPTGYI